jgi:3-hydroxybutyryl-CoA dehydratase
MKMVHKRHDAWGEIRVDDTLPELRRLVTQEHINRYVKASGDQNPLHADPGFAKETIYKSTIAPGLLTLAFVSQLMTNWSLEGWISGGELDVTFVGPLCSGERLLVEPSVASIEERNGDVVAVCDVRCAMEDRAILVGTATRLLDRRKG